MWLGIVQSCRVDADADVAVFQHGVPVYGVVRAHPLVSLLGNHALGGVVFAAFAADAQSAVRGLREGEMAHTFFFTGCRL